MKNIIILLIFLGDQIINTDYMDGVYSMHEGDDKCKHRFSCKNLKRTEKF
jgi:hypothetical protein